MSCWYAPQQDWEPSRLHRTSALLLSVFAVLCVFARNLLLQPISFIAKTQSTAKTQRLDEICSR